MYIETERTVLRYFHMGYAYEACQALIVYAFEHRGIQKIFAETIDPVRSAGLMRKLGMQLEGIQKKQTKDIRGGVGRSVFVWIVEGRI